MLRPGAPLRELVTPPNPLVPSHSPPARRLQRIGHSVSRFQLLDPRHLKPWPYSLDKNTYVSKLYAVAPPLAM